MLIFFHEDTNLQLTLAMLALLVYFFVSSQLQPYRDPLDDFLWNVCLMSVFLSVYLNQLSISQA